MYIPSDAVLLPVLQCALLRTVYQWCSLQDGLCTEQPAEDGGGGEGGKGGGVEGGRMEEGQKWKNDS